MIREIFVPLLGTASDDGALDGALAIAKVNEAHVTAMITLQHPIPLVTEFGYVPVELDQRLLDEARAQAASRAEQARGRLGREAVSSDVRVTESMALWSEETAALQALHCDISVIGRPGADQLDGSPRFALTFRSMLLRSGRPVLVIPYGASLPMPVARVVLAWKPTPEAARALHEVLPLLATAAEIDVLVVNPRVTEGGYGEQPGADVAHLLARHGVKVKLIERAREGLSTGARLLQYLHEVDADLLVMGGYGHRHWRELILGGATRTVIDGAHKAVLFSH